MMNRLRNRAGWALAGTLLATLLLPAGRAAEVTLRDSIVSLASAGTKNYTFTNLNATASVTVALTLSVSSSDPQDVLTFLDGNTRLAIGNPNIGGDGNWIELNELFLLNATLLSTTGEVSTNSTRFRIGGLGIRTDGQPVWVSSASSNNLSNAGETLYSLDTTNASLAGSNYTGTLRVGSGRFQVSNNGALAGTSLVLHASFTQPPTLTTLGTLTNATEDTPFTLSHATLAAAGDAADPDGDTLSFRVESVLDGTLRKNGVTVTPGVTLLSSNETLVWTPPTNGFGTFPAFTLKAWDGLDASAGSVTALVAVAELNDPPRIGTIPTLTNTLEDAAVQFSPELLAAVAGASDEEGATISFLISNVISGSLTKNGTPVTTGATFLVAGDSLVWTPATNAGGLQQAFRVAAWDGNSASVGVNVPIQVSAVNDLPAVASPVPEQAATYGSPFSYTFPDGTFIDVDSAGLTYTATGLPPGISFTPGTRTFSGTPTNTGTHTVSLLATDGEDPGPVYVTNQFNLVVGPASLVVTPANATREYGAANPVFTGTLTGAVGGDIFTATYTCAATNTSPPGPYPITATVNDPGGRLGHYVVTTNTGTLTVVAFLQPTLKPLGLTNGVFYLQMSGVTNAFILETGSTLTNWAPVLTNNAPSDPITLADPDAAGHTHRFYRVVRTVSDAAARPSDP